MFLDKFSAVLILAQIRAEKIECEFFCTGKIFIPYMFEDEFDIILICFDGTRWYILNFSLLGGQNKFKNWTKKHITSLSDKTSADKTKFLNF